MTTHLAPLNRVRWHTSLRMSKAAVRVLTGTTASYSPIHNSDGSPDYILTSFGTSRTITDMLSYALGLINAHI